jgi:hypothetical protein
MQLVDIMRCGLPSDADLGLNFGTTISNTCTYDFNNLLTLMQSKVYQGRTYQLLIQGDDQKYYDISVFMPLSTQGIKRFFLEDTYSSNTQIRILNGFTLSFTFSNGQLNSPKLYPTYTLLSIQSGTVSPSIVTLSYNINYVCDLSAYWTGALVSFIVISIIALVHTIVKTYIGYLNRKSPLLFFLNFTGVYSLWLFYYLLFMTGYWFLFTKTTSSPFLLLPANTDPLYAAIYVLVGIMFIFRLVWSLTDKTDKLSTEVFLINWERGQIKNSWREIFIVNSLAEFYTYRTVSLFWMLAILLFFMTGVGW